MMCSTLTFQRGMFFQRVIKGVYAKEGPNTPGIDDDDARAMLLGGGLLCNWWRNKGTISPHELLDKLSEPALRDHLTDYEAVAGTTPFISMTAGTVERDTARRCNVFFPPLYTALRFATRDFSSDGYVIHAYVYTLGVKAVHLAGFAEEVRDLNTYTDFYLFHPEGEVVAKVEVPATQIEKIEKYTLKGLESTPKGSRPEPDEIFESPGLYRDPLQYANIRGFPQVQA